MFEVKKVLREAVYSIDLIDTYICFVEIEILTHKGDLFVCKEMKVMNDLEYEEYREMSEEEKRGYIEDHFHSYQRTLSEAEFDKSVKSFVSQIKIKEESCHM